MTKVAKVIWTSGFKTSIGGVLLVMALAVSMTAPASAASPFEKGLWLSGPNYDGDVPPCEAALDTIATRFADREATFWNSELAITGFDRVREVAFRPWAENTIPRRFCEAIALVSDGHARRVVYSLSEDGGFAGYGSGVAWCVVGLDRNWSHNPACRIARP